MFLSRFFGRLIKPFGIGLVLSAIFVVSDASAKPTQERYGKVKGWRIHSAWDGPSFAFCSATTGKRKQRLRIAFDGSDWVVGGRAKGKRVRGHVRVDDYGEPVTFERRGRGWVYVRLSRRTEEYLRQGHEFGITFGQSLNREMVFSLNGSAAAMLKVEECVHNRGAQPHRSKTVKRKRPRKPAGQAAAVSRQPISPPAGNCRRGERPLPVSGLCPSKAEDAFLGSYYTTRWLLEAGCKWVVNETEMAGGDVAIYYATKCKGKTARLIYEGGARRAKLRSSADDVRITVFNIDTRDPEASMERIARAAGKKQRARRDCRMQVQENGTYIFDLPPEEVKRISDAEQYYGGGYCGPYGQQDDSSFWRDFGGFGWYVGLGQDAYVSVAPESIQVIYYKNDGNSDSLDGWRISYGR